LVGLAIDVDVGVGRSCQLELAVFFNASTIMVGGSRWISGSSVSSVATIDRQKKGGECVVREVKGVA
jgi:hypothetical protein